MASDHQLDQALQQIEGAILPSISAMLGKLIDSAALARAPADAEACAAEIRILTLQVEELARQMEAATPAARRSDARRAASAT